MQGLGNKHLTMEYNSAKKLMIFGIVVWIGGFIINRLFMNMFFPRPAFFIILGLIFVILEIIGFVGFIIGGILTISKGRGRKTHNVRVARMVK